MDCDDFKTVGNYLRRHDGTPACVHDERRVGTYVLDRERASCRVQCAMHLNDKSGKEWGEIHSNAMYYFSVGCFTRFEKGPI